LACYHCLLNRRRHSSLYGYLPIINPEFVSHQLDGHQGAPPEHATQNTLGGQLLSASDSHIAPVKHQTTAGQPQPPETGVAPGKPQPPETGIAPGKPQPPEAGVAPGKPQPHKSSVSAAPSKHLVSKSGFTQAMTQYWQHISAAKSHHKYITEFPPVYAGMDAPRVAPPVAPPASGPIKSTGKMPSLQDLYTASKDLNRLATNNKSQPDFNLLELPEGDFKKRYAAESVFVGKSFNLDQASIANLVKRIYAFEDGGWGTHFTLSSMPQALLDDTQKEARLNFHPLSSAIGYNQLLISDTVSDIAQHGGAIAARLDQLATDNPARATVLHQKAQMVQELSAELTHSSSPAASKKGLKGSAPHLPSRRMEEAIQSLNLDGDIGPVLQSQELYNLLTYASANKFDDYVAAKTATKNSQATEYDLLTPEKKKAAVDELFALIKPAQIHPDNPALDDPFYQTKETLRAKFLQLSSTGAASPLNKAQLSADESTMMNSNVLTIRRFGGDAGPMPPEARALLDRATFDYLGGFSADRLKAAAIELANLAGMGSGEQMLKPENSGLPTSNFFARNGYVGNPVTSRRSADELLLQIYRVMQGPNSSTDRAGITQFNQAFDSLPSP
jgi:hypothetical protein